MPSAAIAAGGTWRGSRRVLLLLPLVLVVSPAAATTLAELPDLQQEAAALHAAWAGDASQRQCFGFSLSSSIARDDFEYPDLTTGARRVAKKGAAATQAVAAVGGGWRWRDHSGCCHRAAPS